MGKKILSDKCFMCEHGGLVGIVSIVLLIVLLMAGIKE